MGLLPTSIPTSLDQLNPFSRGTANEELAPSLSIVELTGEQRALLLGGRTLPHGATSFGRGGQRTRKTTYAGNPQSTQQVLGPEEGDCTLRGFWKSRFIQGEVKQVGFPREVGAASDLVEFVDSMRLAGQTVQVQWGPVVRVGIIVGFEPTWHRVQDVEWELEFEWQSQGQVTTKARKAAVRKPSLLDKLNAVSDIFALGPDFLLPDVNAMLVSAIADTRQKIGKIFEALMLVAKLGRLPADVAGAIAAAAASLRLQVLETVNALAEVPVSMITPVSSLVVVTEMEFWRRDMSFSFMDLLAEVGIVEEQTAQRASPPALAIVVVKQASSLYQVSNEHYGTPDLAGFLAEVNFLDDTNVPAGTTLVIPPKPQTLEP